MKLLARFAVFLVTVQTAVAAEEAGGRAERAVTWAPNAEFYPQYIADPLRPQSALKILGVANSEIPETGSARFGLHLGGRFGIIRWHPADRPDCGWQLDFEGGFFGHFDIGNSLDNIGWDGLYGLYLSWMPRRSLGFRFGTKHDSAHIGDEYAERTGRRRMGYTREELVLGASWRPTDGWRVYLEAGFSYDPKPFQEPGRIEAGGEWFGRRRLWGERASWFAALDVQLFQETGWRPGTTVQVGLLMPTGRGTSRYRFALELTHGRSVLGEFVFDDETSIGIGWYFDF